MKLRERSPTWLIALGTVAVTFAALAHVWVRLQIINISYDINTLSGKEKVLREECYNVSSRINEAKSPRRLERLATMKFGMQTPRAHGDYNSFADFSDPDGNTWVLQEVRSAS